MRARLALLISFLCSVAPSQSLHIYSEFRRFTRSGELLPQDRGGKPREILSPGLVRNAWHSFRVALSMPAGHPYALYIAQNPEDVALVRLYREKNEGELEPVQLPVQGTGQGGYETFWLDIFLPALTDLKRFRLEAQLYEGSGWVIAPMEVRPLAGILPEVKITDAELPSPKAPAEATAHAALRGYVCGEPPRAMPAARNVRTLQRRNALQDVALAQTLEKSLGRPAVLLGIVRASGESDVESWCAASRPQGAQTYGPEWYLRVRDYLFREVSR
ncbi:MAG: hypothetical protein NZV14_16595 [Bryobacteraceae bacterium]|nr:hypothetical protein [Bryobacteraceae bacterium]MDW8379780.1 hypothetical protein [Bryobacterales bacterium]